MRKTLDPEIDGVLCSTEGDLSDNLLQCSAKPDVNRA